MWKLYHCGKSALVKTFLWLLRLFGSTFIVGTLVFQLVSWLPGLTTEVDDPALPQTAIKEVQKDSQIERIFQFWHGLIIDGDLPSQSLPGAGVRSQITNTLQASLTLTLLSVLISLVGAILLSAVLHRAREHQVIAMFMNLVLATPMFFLAPLIIFVFTVYFRVLPGAFLTGPKNYLLPLFVLSLRPTVVLAYLISSSVARFENTDFVKAARARGASESRIFYKHIMRNSLIAVIAILPHQIYHLIISSILVELLFAIPGSGSLLISALSHRDHNLIAAEIVALSMILFVVSESADSLAKIVDPRVSNISETL